MKFVLINHSSTWQHTSDCRLGPLLWGWCWVTISLTQGVSEGLKTLKAVGVVAYAFVQRTWEAGISISAPSQGYLTRWSFKKKKKWIQMLPPGGTQSKEAASRCLLLFKLMCISGLPAFSYALLVSVESRRGHCVIWNWNYRCLLSAVRALEAKSGPLQEQPILLTIEPPLQPQFLTSLQIRKQRVD